MGPKAESSNIEVKRDPKVSSFFTENRRGIPLPVDFNILARALEIYAHGVESPSEASRKDCSLAVDTSADLAIHPLSNPDYSDIAPVEGTNYGLYSQNLLIADFVQSAEEAYQEGKPGCFQSYNYELQKAFHKTTVEVFFDRDNHALILGLNSARAGKETEDELAKALGVEKAIRNMELEIELPEMDDQDLSVPFDQRAAFRFDCTPLSEVVNSVLKSTGEPYTEIAPEDLAQEFMKKKEYTYNKNYIEDNSQYSVNIGSGIQVVISIYGGHRFVFSEEKEGGQSLLDTRKVEGSVLILPFPVEININEPAMYSANPQRQRKHHTLSIRIERERSSDWGLELPMHTSEQLAKARQIIEFISEQLS